MSYRFLFSAILPVSMLMACQDKQINSASINSDTIPVRIITVQEEVLKEKVEASGQFTTEDETLLAFKIGGIIQQVLVREGDYVQQGQLLATLNPAEIQAQVDQAETALEKAQRDFKRAENLYLDSVATLEQYQNSKTALSIARQQLQIAAFNRQYAAIRASSKGVVLKKLAQEGQVVGPGTPIFQVNGSGKSPWVLKVFVSESDWSRIKTGDEATIISNTSGDTNIDGTIQSCSAAVDPVTGTLWVNIKPLGPLPDKIAAGIFGKAVITPTAAVKGWRIPYDALLEGEGSKGFVFTTRDMKTAEKVAVEIGSIENEYITVTGGLENDKYVIIAGNAYLNNNTPIRIKP
jgi:RND family efflux transporter MFP subunit